MKKQIYISVDAYSANGGAICSWKRKPQLNFGHYKFVWVGSKTNKTRGLLFDGETDDINVDALTRFLSMKFPSKSLFKVTIERIKVSK